jgi:hypothetical protein
MTHIAPLHKLKEIMRILLARFANDKYFASLRSNKARAMGLTEQRIDDGCLALRRALSPEFPAAAIVDFIP